MLLFMKVNVHFQDDTTGDYRSAILALVVGGPPPQIAAKCKLAFSWHLVQMLFCLQHVRFLNN
jgi:hypothetical protein